MTARALWLTPSVEEIALDTAQALRLIRRAAEVLTFARCQDGELFLLKLNKSDFIRQIKREAPRLPPMRLCEYGCPAVIVGGRQ